MSEGGAAGAFRPDQFFRSKCRCHTGENIAHGQLEAGQLFQCARPSRWLHVPSGLQTRRARTLALINQTIFPRFADMLRPSPLACRNCSPLVEFRRLGPGPWRDNAANFPQAVQCGWQSKSGRVALWPVPVKICDGQDTDNAGWMGQYRPLELSGSNIRPLLDGKSCAVRPCRRKLVLMKIE
ncbi:MAG: hypothetical protein ONB48_09630 [candidate division KSB1 bacterium]|nr:hypothetical protein [candidate division KSB1 bacterium]MDZ7273747.1 hypothetical protein [candidate division KSB1 bacterium]MDZ7285903.1 hypothetical protein [candidate division KSB1 bacterium]MDZ7298935.1 hypothetical protein [candidate division KSB1 bacterium]MDZ7307610.1 hypothetical protein [candidate division KSB1 bacterium]